MKKLSRLMMKHRQIANKPALSHQCGFTLIEIAVSLGILLILATMAVPSLLNGVIRNQVKESLALADIATTLMRGRKPMAQRLSVVASSVADAVSALRAVKSSVAALTWCRRPSAPA